MTKSTKVHLKLKNVNQLKEDCPNTVNSQPMWYF